MKKIIIPTDFSEFAFHAGKVALSIAKATGGELHFLHMIGVPSDWLALDLNEQRLYSSVNESVNQANNELDELVRLAKKSGVESKKVLQFQVDHRDIIAYSEKINADLIVMGSHGIGGPGQFLLGSITQKIARYSKVPVLIVKEEIENFQIDNIVFASDLSLDKQRHLSFIHDFAKVMGANVHGLFINTPYSFVDTPLTEKMTEEFTSDYSELFDSFNTYNFKTEEEGIMHFANRVDADLIILITEGRRGISRAFENSVTESVIRYSKIPVLSLNGYQE